MRRQGHFRPTGWLIGAGTLLAMALTAIAAAPGGAATAEKTYATSFEMECVVAPGVLNIRAKEKLKVHLTATGPEEVSTGQEISFHGAQSVIESPVELTESFVSLGANEVKGTATSFVLDGSGLEPTSVNIAKPAEFPSGLPFLAPVEKGKPSDFIIPSKTLSESALTYTFGPERVTANSGNVVATVDAASGFTEPEPGSYQETGHGIITEVEGRNSGAHVIGPLKTVCDAPAGVVAASIPMHSTSTTTTVCIPTTTVPPRLTAIEPNHGPASGGTPVTISGEYLDGTAPNVATAVAVSFGGTNAESVHVNSESSITAIAPPGTGTVNVQVSVATACNEGRVTSSNSLPFTYESEGPVITAVEPNHVELHGHNPVTIRGTNLSGVTAVVFLHPVGPRTTEAAPIGAPLSSSLVSEAPWGGIEGEIAPGTSQTGEVWVVSGGKKSNALPFSFERAIPTVTSIAPDHGPASGGTSVTLVGTGLGEVTTISVGGNGKGPEVVGPDGTSAVFKTPPGTPGTVPVSLFAPGCCSPTVGQFTYEATTETAEYKNWKLAGSITDKKLGQAITLPEGSTFNGSGELDSETGAGSVKGNLSIPPFTSSLKLFGPVGVNAGLTLSATGPLEGTATKSEAVPGDETLSAPVKLNVAINSLGILGLTIPTSCATAEPLALGLVDTLTREELLTKGWSFAGTTSIPKVKCQGGFLSRLFGVILTGLLAGPEDPYSLSVKAPG
jgi:hypothetical protein